MLKLDELLQDPESAKALLSNPLWILPQPEQDALRRCAIVRTIDSDLYTNVLSQSISDEEHVPYETIIDGGFVRRLPGRNTRCQLSPGIRGYLLEQWWEGSPPSWDTIPVELQQLSSRLADTFAAKDMPVEQLYHLLLADREQAGTLYQQLRDRAESAYDLTLYHELLRVYDERAGEVGESGVSLLTPDQEVQRQELYREYESRVLFHGAWYATANYQQRPYLTDLYQQLSQLQVDWVVQLYATGGMGKTSYLRNLAARECVPDHVPVAYVDFDYVEQLGPVADQPWLLLIPIAKKLNVQFADPPFNHFLQSYGEFDPLTNPENTSGPVEREMLLGQFVSLLKRRKQPVILIFDTVENLRHRRLTLNGIYELSRDLHEQANNIRVIFSGRFDLREPLPYQPDSQTTFLNYFGVQRSIEIEPFTDEEAVRYLTEQRGIRDDDPRLEVMIEKGNGNPFKLASLAEFVLNHEDVTIEELETIKNSDVEYLIDRIVERINDPLVRWVLRYGVVRRSITQQFIEDVMLNYIRSYWEGDRTFDDTEDDAILVSSRRGEVFPTAASADIDITHVWNKLKEYAAPYSWLELHEQHGVEELRFQPEVVVPMRYLLLHPENQEQSESRTIYQELHRTASAWYRDQPPTASSVSERAYHKFLSGDKDASQVWFDLIKKYDTKDNFVVALCERLLGELVDTTEFGESEVVTIPDVVKARAELELAWRTIPLDGRRLRDAPLPDKRWLLDFEPALPTELPRRRWVTVEAARWLAKQQPERALELITAEIRNPLVTALHQADRRLLLVLVELLLVLPSDHPELRRLLTKLTARSDFNSVVVRLNVQPDDSPSNELLGIMLATKGARLLEENGNLELAIRLLRNYYRSRRSSAFTKGQCAYNLIRLYAKAGQEHAVKAVAEEYEHTAPPKTSDPQQQHQWRAVHNFWQRNLARECDLTFSRTAGEVELSSSVIERLPSLPDHERLSVKITVEMLNARIAAEESNLTAAITLWREAQHKAQINQSPHERIETSLDMGRTLFEQEHNVREPLQELEKLAGEIGRLPGRAIALQAHLLHHNDRRAQAREQLQAFYNSRFENASINDQIPTLIAALALAVDDIPVIERLEKANLAVSPPTRRLILLQDLAYCQPLSDEKTAARLVHSWLPALPTEDEAQDRPTALLRIADVWRVLGRTAEAEKALQQAITYRDKADKTVAIRPYLWRDLLRAFDRCGWQSVNVWRSQEWLDLLRKTEAWQKNIAYRTLMLIEQATRLVDYAQAYETAADLLAEGEQGGELWRAQFNATAARVAGALGQDNANALLEDAFDQFDRLGNRLAITRLQATPEIVALSKANASPEIIGKDAVSAGSDSVTRWSVLMRLGTTGRVQRPVFTAAGTVEIEMTMLPSLFGLDIAAASEPFPFAFVEQFIGNWQRVSDRLGDMLFDNQELKKALPPHALERPLDYVLQTDPDYGWLPWEFALLPYTSFFTLAQPGTFIRSLRPPRRREAAIKRAQLRVLIVAGSEEMGPSVKGYNAPLRGTLGPSTFYRRAGANVQIIDEFNLELFEKILYEFQPDILHFMAKMGDERGDAIILGRDYNDFSPIHPKSIARLTKKAATLPLLILDASSASSIHERVRQLCLRNRFAAEIAEMGSVRHILAVGVAERDANRVLLEQLISGISEGKTLAQVVMRLRRLGHLIANPDEVFPDDPLREYLDMVSQSRTHSFETFGTGEALLADLLPFAGVALWSTDIEETFPF